MTSKEGDLSLERVAVGEHLLLGGDNMDLALAHAISEKLTTVGTSLDEWQFLSLVQAVRAGKESLLSDPNLTEVSLAIPSRSRKLLAGTVSTTLTQSEVQQIVVDGFFLWSIRTTCPSLAVRVDSASQGFPTPPMRASRNTSLVFDPSAG